MKAQGRSYDAMIDLLVKFPWMATKYYTVGIRNKIFEAAKRMIGILSRECRANGSTFQGKDSAAKEAQTLPPYRPPGSLPVNPTIRRTPLKSDGDVPHLNVYLLRDLLRAGLNAFGFNDYQRWQLYMAVGDDLHVRERFAISPVCEFWPFQILNRSRCAQEDIVQLYAEILASHPDVKVCNTRYQTSVLFSFEQPKQCLRLQAPSSFTCPTSNDFPE